MSNDIIKNMLLIKFGSLEMITDTVEDSDVLYSMYHDNMLQYIIDMYDTINLARDFEVLTDTETETIETTHGKTTTSNNTNSYTGTTTNNLSDTTTSTSQTDFDGTSTNKVYAYNSSNFENDKQDITDNTQTTTSSLTNSNTGTIGNTSTATTNSTSANSGKDTIEREKEWSNNGLYNEYIYKRLDFLKGCTILEYYCGKFVKDYCYFDLSLLGDD